MAILLRIWPYALGKSWQPCRCYLFLQELLFPRMLIMLHARVNTKFRNNQKLSMLNVILWVSYSLIVKQIFTVVKT